MTDVVAVPRTRLRVIPGLDGLRGIAVMGVVVYHYFPQAMPGGFIGVDIFFVLSGFLITSLLLREKAVTGNISLTNFWLRRARRIFPLALVVLVITTAIVGVVGGDFATGLRYQFFGTALFVNNWVQIIQGNSYFDQSEIAATSHYWSLSIEEQYYLIWPLIVIISLAIVKRKRLLVLIVLLLASGSSLAMALLYTPGEDATRVYYGTDTHAFGLLLGSLLAIVIVSNYSDGGGDSFQIYRWFGVFRYDWIRQWVPATALSIIFVMVLMMPDSSEVAYRGGLVLASVLTAIVIVGLVCGGNVTEELCTISVLRWLGKRSFSLYLWHWPVFKIMEYLGPSWLFHFFQVMASFIISIVLSQWSYRNIEVPIVRKGYRDTIRDWWRLSSFRKMVTMIAGISAVCTTAAYGIVAAPTTSSLENDLSRYKEHVEQSKSTMGNVNVDVLNGQRVFPSVDQITMVGDSVMLASWEALQSDFPGVYIDAEVSRHYNAVEEILQDLDSRGTLGNIVVLGFGTNGPSGGAGDADVLKRISDLVGKERVLIYVLPYGDREYMPDAESELLDLASRSENIYVADWCHAARDNPNFLRDDLIHPSQEGGVAYSKSIRSAIEQWVSSDKVIPGKCGV